MAQKKFLTFETYKKIVIIILMVMLGIVVILSIAHVGWSLIDNVIFNLNEFDFQRGIIDIFGLFFLVLVGVELLETLKLYTKEQVVHVEVVLLVGLIVAARKIILIDYSTTPSDIFFGIAAIIIAIGVAYYLIKISNHYTETKEY